VQRGGRLTPHTPSAKLLREFSPRNTLRCVNTVSKTSEIRATLQRAADLARQPRILGKNDPALLKIRRKLRDARRAARADDSGQPRSVYDPLREFLTNNSERKYSTTISSNRRDPGPTAPHHRVLVPVMVGRRRLRGQVCAVQSLARCRKGSESQSWATDCRVHLRSVRPSNAI
jgi:hypothetical protein